MSKFEQQDPAARQEGPLANAFAWLCCPRCPLDNFKTAAPVKSCSAVDARDAGHFPTFEHLTRVGNSHGRSHSNYKRPIEVRAQPPKQADCVGAVKLVKSLHSIAQLLASAYN